MSKQNSVEMGIIRVAPALFLLGFLAGPGEDASPKGKFSASHRTISQSNVSFPIWQSSSVVTTVLFAVKLKVFIGSGYMHRGYIFHKCAAETR